MEIKNSLVTYIFLKVYPVTFHHFEFIKLIKWYNYQVDCLCSLYEVHVLVVCSNTQYFLSQNICNDKFCLFHGHFNVTYESSNANKVPTFSQV